MAKSAKRSCLLPPPGMGKPGNHQLAGLHAVAHRPLPHLVDDRLGAPLGRVVEVGEDPQRRRRQADRQLHLGHHRRRAAQPGALALGASPGPWHRRRAAP